MWTELAFADLLTVTGQPRGGHLVTREVSRKCPPIRGRPGQTPGLPAGTQRPPGKPSRTARRSEAQGEGLVRPGSSHAPPSDADTSNVKVPWQPWAGGAEPRIFQMRPLALQGQMCMANYDFWPESWPPGNWGFP